MNSDESQIPEQASEHPQPETPPEEVEGLPLPAEDRPSKTPLDLTEETEDLWAAEASEQSSEAVIHPEPPAETPAATADAEASEEADSLSARIAQLQHQEQTLQQQVSSLQAEVERLQTQLSETQSAMGRLVQEGLSELEQRKKKLQITVEQLERRSERIRSEMRSTFAGVSQDLAIRVQGFKDYLVGSLQELAATAEQLELVPEPGEVRSAPVSREEVRERDSSRGTTPKFAEQGFQEQVRQIRRLLDQYRSMPDYYGPPWQLRRTFEPVHADRVSNWFFTQGGRGAIRTLGSRLQNILVASATLSVMRSLYGDRVRTLVLANSPERLGEWRRGLQDCLGITRGDFGPNQGVVLFESPEAVAQKADRLIQDGMLPFIVIDETENQVNLGMLQFPLWLAFAPDPDAPPPVMY